MKTKFLELVPHISNVSFLRVLLLIVLRPLHVRFTITLLLCHFVILFVFLDLLLLLNSFPV